MDTRDAVLILLNWGSLCSVLIFDNILLKMSTNIQTLTETEPQLLGIDYTAVVS